MTLSIAWNPNQTIANTKLSGCGQLELQWGEKGEYAIKLSLLGLSNIKVIHGNIIKWISQKDKKTGMGICGSLSKDMGKAYDGLLGTNQDNKWKRNGMLPLKMCVVTIQSDILTMHGWQLHTLCN
jgi:hypothetical protein